MSQPNQRRKNSRVASLSRRRDPSAAQSGVRPVHPDAAFYAQVEEFIKWMTACHAGETLSLGITHSVATGEPLPTTGLRFSVAGFGGYDGVCWGVAALTDPNVFQYPQHGFRIAANALPDVVRGLREQLCLALLGTNSSAMLVTTKERALPGFLIGAPQDRFAAGGAVAKEAAEIVQGVKQGRATVGSVFGNQIAFMNEGARPPHKLKPTLSFGGGVQ